MANAAFQIIRGGVRPTDLATILAGGKARHMTILSCWGLIADVDIDSENLRPLGKDARYVLYTIKNVAERKSYHGRLHYLPLEGDETDSTDYGTNSKQTGRRMYHQSECKPQTLHSTVGAKATSLKANKEGKQSSPTEEATGDTTSYPNLLNNHSSPRIPLHLLPPVTKS